MPGWATCKSFTLAFNLTFTVLLWPLKRTRFTLKQPLWTLWRPRTALSGQIWSQLLPASPSELVSQLSCSFSSYQTFSLQPGPSFGPKHTFVGLWRSLKTHKRPQLALIHLFSVSLYVFGSRHGPKSSLARFSGPFGREDDVIVASLLTTKEEEPEEQRGLVNTLWS